MDRQTEMNDAAGHDSESDAFARYVTAVAQDLARIAELQARLFAVVGQARVELADSAPAQRWLC
jgi:hypothetical protein